MDQAFDLTAFDEGILAQAADDVAEGQHAQALYKTTMVAQFRPDPLAQKAKILTVLAIIRDYKLGPDADRAIKALKKLPDAAWTTPQLIHLARLYSTDNIRIYAVLVDEYPTPSTPRDPGFVATDVAASLGAGYVYKTIQIAEAEQAQKKA